MTIDKYQAVYAAALTEREAAKQHRVMVCDPSYNATREQLAAAEARIMAALKAEYSALQAKCRAEKVTWESA